MSEMRTLRPGLLVSLHTSIKGNIAYRKQDIENAHIAENGEQRARWETERIITDPAEHEAAVKVRGQITYLIRSVCAKSAFGLLCPEANAEKLVEAIATARKMADEFNVEAGLTRISVNVIYGRIAADDIEAVRAITGEIRSLLEDMQEGVKALDAKAIRDAASKAVSMGDILTPGAKDRLDIAIEAARKAARRISKAGETAALRVDRVAISRIELARTSFLDLDIEASQLAEPEMSGRSIDLEV